MKKKRAHMCVKKKKKKTVLMWLILEMLLCYHTPVGKKVLMFYI